MGKPTCAALAVLSVLAWQYATVNANFHGDWTALFCTSDSRAVPPWLAPEPIYRFAGSPGYDGQFTHIIAHRPLPQPEDSPYFDAPTIRYRRILLPGLAWLMAFGRDPAIHFTYVAAGALFVAAGTWWLARFVEASGAGVAWSLLFVLFPASLIYLHRLTVDVALAALTAGFALYSVRRPCWQLYAVLLLAPLARETGLLLTIAYCAYCLIWKHVKWAAVMATSAIPWMVWIAYVEFVMGEDAFDTSFIPFRGLIRFLTRPEEPAWVPFRPVVLAADVLALTGILAAVLLAGALVWRRRSEPVALGAALFGLLAVLLQRTEVWAHEYSYARIFTPLVLLVFAGWLPTRRALAVLPLAMLLPRLVMQHGREIVGVLTAAGR